MSSTYNKFKVGDIVEHIGGRGNTGKVTRVTTDKITVVFEDSSKDYNYNSNTRSLRLVKEKTVETINTKHICEVLEEKVNLKTAIRFAKNYTEWASSKDYSDSITNASSLISSFLWSNSKEGNTFWCKIQDRVFGIKATATYSTFTKYANMLLPGEVEEIKEQEITYPIYKKSKTNGVVVKFTDLSCGFIVNRGDTLMDINDYSTTWKPHTTKSQWEDFDFIEPKEEIFKKVLKEQLSATKEPKTKPIQTKTESTIMTKLKITATSVATQNKDAIKAAAKLEAGKIINKQVIKQVKPHLPLLVRGLADHPAASIVLANVVSIAVKHFMPENKKLNTVAELMLGAAAVDTVASFNIEAFVEDLLKNIKLPTGALDDDN